ncbi:MAG: response regulator [Holophaga sp.]|nr:response regulator [Holophaga sp.]
MPGILRRILLVEDSSADAELTHEALLEYAVANGVDWVKDGAEALDFLFCRGAFQGRIFEPPAVILLDLKLPKIDGLEVLRTIRTTPHLQAIPVVVLTSSQEEKDLIHGYSHGANAYVVKPVDGADFIKAVGSLGVFWAMVNAPPPALPPEVI